MKTKVFQHVPRIIFKISNFFQVPSACLTFRHFLFIYLYFIILNSLFFRIGRTGRVGNTGQATSIYDPEEDGVIVNDLVKILHQSEQPDWLAAQVGNISSRLDI